MTRKRYKKLVRAVVTTKVESDDFEEVKRTFYNPKKLFLLNLKDL